MVLPQQLLQQAAACWAIPPRHHLLALLVLFLDQLLSGAQAARDLQLQPQRRRRPPYRIWGRDLRSASPCQAGATLCGAVGWSMPAALRPSDKPLYQARTFAMKVLLAEPRVVIGILLRGGSAACCELQMRKASTWILACVQVAMLRVLSQLDVKLKAATRLPPHHRCKTVGLHHAADPPLAAAAAAVAVAAWQMRLQLQVAAFLVAVGTGVFIVN